MGLAAEMECLSEHAAISLSDLLRANPDAQIFSLKDGETVAAGLTRQGAEALVRPWREQWEPRQEMRGA